MGSALDCFQEHRRLVELEGSHVFGDEPIHNTDTVLGISFRYEDEVEQR